MLLSILFAVFFLFLFVAAVVLCAPIAVVGSGNFAADRAEGIVRISWLHPKTVRCVLDIRKGTLEVVAFGMRISKRETAAAAAKEEKKAAEVSAEPFAAMHGTEPGAPGAQLSKEEETVSKPQSAKDEKPAQEKSPVETREKEKETISWMVRLKQIWVFAGDDSFRGKTLRWVFRMLRSLIRTCSLARVRVSVKAGFDDPAKTGLLYGWYQGVTHMLMAPGARRVEIACEPIFTDATFETAAEAELATSVARLCLPIIVAVVTFPYLHAYVLYRRARVIK